MDIFILKIEGNKDVAFYNKDLAELNGVISGKSYIVESIEYNQSEDVEIDFRLEEKEVFISDECNSEIKIEVEINEGYDEVLTDIVPFTEEEIYSPFKIITLEKAKIGNILIENLNVSINLKKDLIATIDDYIERLNE